MDNKSAPEPSQPPLTDSEVEEHLIRLFRLAAPEVEYAARLEQKLEQQAARLGDTGRRRAGGILTAAWRWGLGAVGLALLAGIILLAISSLPQRPSALPAVASTATPLASGGGETAGGDLTTTATPVAGTPTPQPTPTPLIYRVVPGDTCLSIAFKFGVSLEDLLKRNGLTADCTNLIVDDELTIPVTASPEPGATPYAISRNADVQINLRAGPGTEYPVVGTISGEDTVPVRSGQQQGEWIAVDYLGAPDGIAWVWSVLVTVIGPPAQTPTPTATLQVSAENPRRDGDALLVDVCFELPDHEDWMVNESLLSYADEQGSSHQAPPSGGMLISLETPAADGAHGQRCDVLEFNLPATGGVISPTLEILSISAYPREGQTCAAYQTRVQPLLDERRTGITIACEEVPHGSNMSIASRPEELSEADAQSIVYQTFMEAISIRGAWKFDLGALVGSAGLPNLEAQQPVLAELRALNQQRLENYYPSPGWLHLRVRELYQASPGSLSDGRSIPLEYFMDYWYSLNEAGLVERSITRMLSTTGEQLRLMIFEDGMVSDSESTESYPQEPYEPGPLDYAFTDLVESGVKTGKQLSSGALMFEGNYVGEQFVLEDDESRWESLYNPQTGQQISLMTWRNIADGLQFFSSVHFEVLEKDIEPPAELLALLD